MIIKKIHIWVPGLCQTGGIQVFSSFLTKALKQNPNMEIDVFSKQDIPSQLNSNQFKKINHKTFGHWPQCLRTFIFSTAIFLDAAIKRPHLIIITLAHFAPVAMFLNKICKVPYIVVAHGLEVWDMKRPALKASLEAASLILAVSQHTKNRIIAQSIKLPERIKVFFNTYDEKRFFTGKNDSIRKKHGLSPQDFILISVGRIVASERYKGHEIVMQALKKLLPENSNLKYLIVGEGNYRETLEDIVTSSGIKAHVVFAGRVSEEELPDYYRASDLFIMPSKGEGFGIVYLEAMACGLPVIAGSQDGSVDALRNGELGILINPDSVSEAADAIRTVMYQKNSQDIWRQQVQLSQAVRRYFGFESFQKQLTDFLEPWMEN